MISFARDWQSEAAGRAFEAWQAGGYIQEGGVVTPELIGAGVVQVLSLPAEASIFTLDIRPR